MTFIIIVLILGGLALVFSGIENTSILSYIQQWTGGKSSATK